jgi:hypothetical protein
MNELLPSENSLARAPSSIRPRRQRHRDLQGEQSAQWRIACPPSSALGTVVFPVRAPLPAAYTVVLHRTGPAFHAGAGKAVAPLRYVVSHNG